MTDDLFSKLGPVDLVRTLYDGRPKMVEQLRKECEEAQVKGCDDAFGKTLLMAREQIVSLTTGPAPTIAALFAFASALNLRVAAAETDGISSVADAVYEVHSHLAKARHEKDQAPLSPRKSVEHALSLIERHSISSLPKLLHAIAHGVSPATERTVDAEPTHALQVSPLAAAIDDSTALAVGFKNKDALARFCNENGITVRELPDLVYAIQKFSVRPIQVAQVLQDGVRLPEFIRQLRVSEEYDIVVLETVAEDELSPRQLDILRNTPWGVEAFVLAKFSERFGLDAVGLEDETSDLMIAIERTMYAFPGTLNEVLKEAVHLAESHGLHDLDLLFDRLGVREGLDAIIDTEAENEDADEFEFSDEDEVHHRHDRAAVIANRGTENKPWLERGQPARENTPVNASDAEDDADDFDIPDIDDDIEDDAEATP